jgi:hypothetical protein
MSAQRISGPTVQGSPVSRAGLSDGHRQQTHLCPNKYNHPIIDQPPNFRAPGDSAALQAAWGSSATSNPGRCPGLRKSGPLGLKTETHQGCRAILPRRSPSDAVRYSLNWPSSLRLGAASAGEPSEPPLCTRQVDIRSSRGTSDGSQPPERKLPHVQHPSLCRPLRHHSLGSL